jgi:CDP-glucose 4,6-dehydratase
MPTSSPMDVFRGRSVFLTGHTGFKGSWLALWLGQLGAHVHGFSLAPPTSPSLFEDAVVADGLASHTIGDVRDFEALMRAMATAKPDAVFHLAAQPLVRRSHAAPRETYDVNVMGTVNVLEAIRSLEGVRVCQVITSDKCYENRGWVYPYRENDAMGGADPYSSSKGCAELVVAAYRQTFFPPDRWDEHGVSVASCRAGNVIGGGDWADDRIIPDCVRALQDGRPIPVRSPASVRPWQHVLEPLRGYLELAARQFDGAGAFADAFNFGPPPVSHVRVRDVVEMVLGCWGAGSWDDLSPGLQDTRAASEATVLRVDSTKATALVHWRPLLTIQKAVAMSVEWYLHRAANQSASQREFTLWQLSEYSATAAIQ